MTDPRSETDPRPEPMGLPSAHPDAPDAMRAPVDEAASSPVRPAADGHGRARRPTTTRRPGSHGLTPTRVITAVPPATSTGVG